MKFVIQRVQTADVTIDGQVTGKIGKGFLVFIGISEADDETVADKMIKKLIGLRIFSDSQGKTNLDLKAVNGELLLISQFTLYADCRRGNRPSFIQAGSPEKADKLYRYIVNQCQKEIPVVKQGIFGADMKVSLQNDGPFTIILDSEQILGH